jgi:hypothetical protein
MRVSNGRIDLAGPGDEELPEHLSAGQVRTDDLSCSYSWNISFVTLGRESLQ